MTQTVQEFQQRMRIDRSFRKRILAARRAGNLDATLVEEGYGFDHSSLAGQFPQVRTGIRAGADDHSTSCYCLI